jgi:hypothetical protein
MSLARRQMRGTRCTRYHRSFGADFGWYRWRLFTLAESLGGVESLISLPR